MLGIFVIFSDKKERIFDIICIILIGGVREEC